MNKILAVLLALNCVLLSCKNDTTETASEEQNKEIAFNLPEGFILEDLYQPSANEQGSWVALAQGPNDIIYACDQYGKIYYFNPPAIGQKLKLENVNALDLEIGEAHGMLWAFNSLYVAVNKRWKDDVPDEEENGSGIYRITDNNHDGRLDKVEMLLKLDGAGEHGPHSFVLSPDGKEIYFIAGNHTLVPNVVKENSRLPTNWGEDNLFKPYLDARGHANDIKAPGGWICKFNPEGTDWELISAGYRNPFDIAFNEDGELFAYDADMEWDIGMPWYRPTRICHVTSGSEYGWRTGSGKWPAYYPDALPAVHNLEQGSPTAVLSGAELDFPGTYKNGIFVMDWSFGTLYFADLKPKGSSYTAERKEFLSGTPLPLTDMIAGADGNLYFASGGRRIDSHLFRLRYTGSDSKEREAIVDTKTGELRKLRRSLEKYHSGKSKSSELIQLAWANLNHEDRYIRYAARIALEKDYSTYWVHRFFAEKDPIKIIESSIVMSKRIEKKEQQGVIKKLNSINLSKLQFEQQVALLRAYQLNFIRMGKPEFNTENTVQALKSHFPNDSDEVNRELGQLLLYLDADGITEELVALLDKHTKEGTTLSKDFLSEEITERSEQYGPLIREILDKMPPSEAIYYGVLLSHADKGWTKEAREKYFNWFYDVLNSKGGLSFKPGMENIRLAAMKNVPDDQKEYFQEMSGVYSPSTAIAELPQPIGPGNEYGGREIGQLVWGDELADYQVDYKKGKRAFQAGMCVLCHRIRGEGAGVGPDLTQAHTKFNNYEMLFATYSPNDEISDQYANTLFHLKDGKKISGRIKSENDGTVIVMPNPFNESYTVDVAKENISKREPSPLSPMPSGLLNRLNPKEIKDLFAYLQAGGDESHEVYSEKIQ
ncbi:c-type cytochrome [Maribacter algarum]|uniref:C-type cytochrome n=1 Tax=Maribacter algarum (ex Zhang et al. 2020) TaxID=2578118 RepID=A0A5S3PP86_9FLAO|nr:c-type cytochrome [Maribacter algarum]TMM56181.1 c-type cytochrome [Maribacter algarum]